MIQVPILSPELEQHFIDKSPGYGGAIGDAIDTAIDCHQIGAGNGFSAGPTGIVNERTFTPGSAVGWPGNVTIGEVRVPNDLSSPSEYNRISARYIRELGQGSLWMPNWFSESSRNPILEYDTDVTDTIQGLNRVHGESSDYRRALVAAPEAMRHQMRPALVRAGYLLARAGIIEVPATLLPADGLKAVV